MVAKNGYDETSLGTFRYKCRETSKGGYPISKVGNYESLLSFKELPPYKELQKKGRKWINTKNYAPVMDRIFIDVDAGDLQKAFDVTKAILQDLDKYRSCINVYFSGSKGFHIELLTDELDIIDITVDKPMDSCYQYVNFLNYFMNKYDEVDLSLKDVGTRIVRRHHTKHRKTGNYKVLIDVNASLDKIINSSKANKDMVEPVTERLSADESLLLMNTYSKPVEQDAKLDFEAKVIKTDDSIYSIVFNEMNTNLHNKIFLLGSGLNGYVTEAELETIYNGLCQTTNIEDSDNPKGTFFDAYRNDKKPYSIGAIRYHYEKYKLDQENFDKLSYHLQNKLQSKHYNDFNKLFESYGFDWFKMLESELFDYVDNTENIFKAIIHCVCALFGYKKASRMLGINGGAEVGKSELIRVVAKLFPYFIDLGSSTPASIRRRDTYYFDKKIVYIGDRGLRGHSQQSKEEFEGLFEVFGGLVTEHKFKRDIVVGNEVMDFNLKSDGIVVLYTEPYTNLRLYGAGDQYTTRNTSITVNPVEDGLSLFLQDENKTNGFYNIHKNYIRYIVKHPIELKISKEVKTAIYYASKDSLRTAKYLLDLFKGYCQYIQLGNPLTTDVEKFLDVFKPQIDVTAIEYEVYTKLYNNLHPLTKDEVSYKVTDDGGIANSDDILLQVKNRKEKSFFTTKQIQTYFKGDFKNNKNLKDTIDQVGDILQNLYNAELLERLEWQYNNQDVYYIPYNRGIGK